MIFSDLRNHKGLKIEGNIKDVSAECILIMKEIYKKNKEMHNQEVAAGILINMMVKAMQAEMKEEGIEWKVSEEEKLNYTD